MTLTREQLTDLHHHHGLDTTMPHQTTKGIDYFTMPTTKPSSRGQPQPRGMQKHGKKYYTLNEQILYAHVSSEVSGNELNVDMCISP